MKNVILLLGLVLVAIEVQAQDADTLIKKHIVLDSVVIMPLPEYIPARLRALYPESRRRYGRGRIKPYARPIIFCSFG